VANSRSGVSNIKVPLVLGALTVILLCCIARVGCDGSPAELQELATSASHADRTGLEITDDDRSNRQSESFRSTLEPAPPRSIAVHVYDVLGAAVHEASVLALVSPSEPESVLAASRTDVTGQCRIVGANLDVDPLWIQVSAPMFQTEQVRIASDATEVVVTLPREATITVVVHVPIEVGAPEDVWILAFPSSAGPPDTRALSMAMGSASPILDRGRQLTLSHPNIDVSLPVDRALEPYIVLAGGQGWMSKDRSTQLKAGDRTELEMRRVYGATLQFSGDKGETLLTGGNATLPSGTQLRSEDRRASVLIWDDCALALAGADPELLQQDGRAYFLASAEGAFPSLGPMRVYLQFPGYAREDIAFEVTPLEHGFSDFRVNLRKTAGGFGTLDLLLVAGDDQSIAALPEKAVPALLFLRDHQRTDKIGCMLTVSRADGVVSLSCAIERVPWGEYSAALQFTRLPSSIDLGTVVLNQDRLQHELQLSEYGYVRFSVVDLDGNAYQGTSNVLFFYEPIGSPNAPQKTQLPIDDGLIVGPLRIGRHVVRSSKIRNGQESGVLSFDVQPMSLVEVRLQFAK
jgi:hypothetical protein